MHMKSVTYDLTLGRIRKFILLHWVHVEVGVGGVDGAPQICLYVAIFRNDFTFSERPLFFLTSGSPHLKKKKKRKEETEERKTKDSFVSVEIRFQISHHLTRISKIQMNISQLNAPLYV